MTTIERLSEPIPAEPDVGNYFVSAYPPFSHWQPNELDAVKQALCATPMLGTDVPLGLYLHVPFCVHRCQFCYYRSFSGKTRVEMDGYVDSLLSELSLYSSQPALSGRKLDFVYFGGGTPSMLSVEQIQRLLDGVQLAFPWTEVREASFECAPKTTTRRRLGSDVHEVTAVAGETRSHRQRHMQSGALRVGRSNI